MNREITGRMKILLRGLLFLGLTTSPARAT